ncbi:ribbon-helix-helix domain-containing protein [Candidatus Pacearchaeota archaeon]|nr:ribbon-helix-helix domain-containing protein [Candidatus Pacearchaeota archaeon]
MSKGETERMEAALSIRIDTRLIDAIDQDARASMRSRAQMVRLIITEHYKAKGIDVDAPAEPAQEGQGSPPEGDDIPF